MKFTVCRQDREVARSLRNTVDVSNGTVFCILRDIFKTRRRHGAMARPTGNFSIRPDYI
jgi:hypothetical protein